LPATKARRHRLSDPRPARAGENDVKENPNDQRYLPLTRQGVEAIRERLFQAHPSWYKPLALKRRGDAARAAADTLAWAAVHGLHGARLLVCQMEGLPRGAAICGLAGNYGAHQEPLACAYP